MRRNVVVILLALSLMANVVLAVLLVRSPAAPSEPVAAAELVSPTATTAPTATVRPGPAVAVAQRSGGAEEQGGASTEAPTATPIPAPTLELTLEPAPEPTLEPTLEPTPEPSPTIGLVEPEWLAYLNRFRGAAQLPRLSEDTAWSAESGLHSRYMSLTGEVRHSQDVNSPHYTASGSAAAETGNIAIGHLSASPYQWAINYWLSAPFHAVPMLDPQLATTGFGEYRDAAAVLPVAATLDVARGLGPVPDGVQFPIMWPGNDSVTWVLRYSLPEFPAALSHCAGYVQPTGAPIILQIGDGSQTPNVTATTLLRDGEPISHCRFDETSFTHPDPWIQRSARAILDQRDAIVIIPQAPMTPDATYAVRVDVNGETHTWSFRTAAGPQ